MKISKRPLIGLRLALTIVIFFLGILSKVGIADDTDIFVGGAPTTEESQPNILFILDNSGSMFGQVYDEVGNPTGKSRLETMKETVDDIVRNVSGVNIGLMRFNAPGGSIMYPVSNISKIDEDFRSLFVTNSSDRIGADDAVELATSGNVYVDNETLILSHRPNPEAGGTISIFLEHEDDDAEESSNGKITSNQAQFDMMNNQINGLRYLNLGIPAGATIVDARLDFYSVTTSGNYIRLQIQGQDEKNPERFNTSKKNVSDRLASSTTAVVDWEITGFDPWTAGTRYQSPNIAPILQEIIDRPDWSANDAVVFLLTQTSGTGQRAGILRREDRPQTQGITGQSTLLHVTYTTSEDAMTDQIVGVRFNHVEVPQGATITNARLDFTSAMSNITNPDSLKLRIRAENTGNSDAFSDSRYNLSSRTKFPDSIDWHPDDDWSAEEVVQGANITTLVQNVIDHGDWCGNNAMAFFIEPKTLVDVNSRIAYATEAGLGRYPSLSIEYKYDPDSAPPGTGCNDIVLEYRVNSVEDDAQQNKANEVDNNEDILLIDKDYTNGFRFQNVGIEQGATILEAYIEFRAYPYGFGGFPGSTDDNTGNSTMQLRGDNTSNSPEFVQSPNNISQRSATTAKVDWSLDDWIGYDSYRSPDIKAIVQEIVNRGDWSSGNALSIIQEAVGNGARGAFSFDASVADGPKLIIKVASGGAEFTGNTIGDYINGLVQDLDATAWTPIVDSLYEAARYYRGDPLYYGATREIFPQIDGTMEKRYKRVSVEESYTGGSHTLPPGCTESDLNAVACESEEVTGAPVYISPITHECQTNHIVLLTDGTANNNHSESVITAMTGDATCSSDTVHAGEKCGRTLARWLATTDQAKGFPSTINTVQTHTIAFNLTGSNEIDFLRDLATEGDGAFHTANTASELTNAFDEIIRDILSVDATFVSPGATVNQFNRLTHRSEVYFSLFKPGLKPSWAGNLKRYQLLGNPAVLSDANGISAIDQATGFFKNTAKSVWATEVDGSSVEFGGAASKLPMVPSNRNLYTYITSKGTPSKTLTSVSNKFHETNSDIDMAMVGASTEGEREFVLQWARGVDLKDYDNDGDTSETRLQFGDPLHSVPQIVTYGGTDDDPDTSIFFGTNEGFLHAVSGKTGEEIFSFIPEQVLGNLATLYKNSSSDPHPYGLDGSPAVWVEDLNADGSIESGDHVYVYMGMRRGGRNLYALDVTDRSSPKMLWVIEGGTGDFADLGQTWSKPVKTQIQIGSGGPKDVLIFGGGFDANQDSAITRTSDGTGAAIYIVDAETGQRLWMASAKASGAEGLRVADMDYSIPSDIAVVDVNQDGLADQLYVGDMGGQLWRFDIHQGESAASLVTGSVIADIAGDGFDSNRRFFNEPDVSVFATREGGVKIAIAMGSGTRFRPLDRNVLDRFYVFYQDDVFSAPETYVKLDESDLEDRTGNLDETLVSGSGWYMSLEGVGEKVLAASLTINKNIIFTTYQPDAVASACKAVIGQGRAYVVRLLTGSPAADLNGDGSIDANDFSVSLSSGAIPPPPKMLFPEGSTPVVLVGPEQPLQNVDFGIGNQWQRSYWFESEQ